MEAPTLTSPEQATKVTSRLAGRRPDPERSRGAVRIGFHAFEPLSYALTTLSPVAIQAKPPPSATAASAITPSAP